MGLLVPARRGAGVLVLKDHDDGESARGSRSMLAVKNTPTERFVATLCGCSCWHSNASSSVYCTGSVNGGAHGGMKRSRNTLAMLA